MIENLHELALQLNDLIEVFSVLALVFENFIDCEQDLVVLILFDLLLALSSTLLLVSLSLTPPLSLHC